MLLGIDIGGTNTDCALIENGQLVAHCKIPTTENCLLQAIEQAISEVLARAPQKNITRFNLSTTLCTNALVKGETPPVAVLATRGPGIVLSADFLPVEISWLGAVMDHRGVEILPLQSAQIEEIASQCKARGIEYYAVVGKFSPKNPSHENQIAAALQGQAKHITLGHRLCGRLNFPRRLASAYFNAAVWQSFAAFAEAAKHSTKRFGINQQPAIIKADGGTMSLDEAANFPLESVFSGPAASIMGILTLTNCQEDALVLDIGGTTTDIALLSAGVPVLKPDGITLQGRPTLIRSVESLSIGIGGDSLARLKNGEPCVGPKRQGPCLAMGGPAPTLMDACNVLGLSHLGEIQKSRSGLNAMARQAGTDATALASQIVQKAVNTIFHASHEMLARVNAKPVYTIDELLSEKAITPKRIIVMGGPAKTLAPELENIFGLPVTVPPHAEVANAIGAALTCPTASLELFADTAKGFLSVPRYGIQKDISPDFDLSEAIATGQLLLTKEMKKSGETVSPRDIQILEESSFNMIEGYSRTGRNIRVKCQLQPRVTRLNSR